MGAIGKGGLIVANLSADAIDRALTNLADPKVNYRIDLASTPHVAGRIIQSLPGVKELIEDGPAVADALLSRLNEDQVLDDEYFASISLHILWHYPSERVKRALATPITQRRFSGFSSQFAAEAFLRAAGIDTTSEKAIATALREARKLELVTPTKMKGGGKIQPKAGKIQPKGGGKIQPKASAKPSQKKMTAAARKKSRSQKKKSRDSSKSRSRAR
jgi:hypothetical protein